jgi:uncharacterized membrane protein
MSNQFFGRLAETMWYVKDGLKWLLGLFFVFAGINHFRDPGFYLKLMPDYIPANLHGPAVLWSGIAEVLLGVLLLIPRTSRWAAWGIIALLVAVFPANIYGWQHSEEIFGISKEKHFIRLPLQAVLIAWAWWYTRPKDIGVNPPDEVAPRP